MKPQAKVLKSYHREHKRTAGAVVAKNHSMASQMEARIATRMATDDDSNLGRIIWRRRIMTPLSLNELSRVTGVSIGYLSRIEKGERNPSARVLHKLSKPLGLNEDELFVIAGYMYPRHSTKSSSSNDRLKPFTPRIMLKESIERIHTVTAVLPDLRKDWLRRYEEYGESPLQIAKKDGYDARTIRKRIQQAQRERELREGRLMMLCSAIESHHRDLCDFVEHLDSQIAGEAPISTEPRSSTMWLALRQHLPRSPLWKSIDKWNKLLEKIDRLRSDIKARLERNLKAETRLRAISASGGSGVLPGMVEALVFQMEQLARGETGFNIEDNFDIKSDKDDLAIIKYGSFNMGKVKKQQATKVRDILISWEAKVDTWEEYYKMERMLQDLKRVQQKLRDDITTLTLRRVVPGQCKYCPA